MKEDVMTARMLRAIFVRIFLNSSLGPVRTGTLTRTVIMTASSDLKTFAKKVAIIAAAFLIVPSLLAWQAQDYLDSKFVGLKGGSAFWVEVEGKLHKLADAPDLPAEKKARILASLKKLSMKYRPYFEALNGEK